jgi:hypothetical protein
MVKGPMQNCQNYRNYYSMPIKGKYREIFEEYSKLLDSSAVAMYESVFDVIDQAHVKLGHIENYQGKLLYVA